MDNLGWGTMFPPLTSGGHRGARLSSVARSVAERARLVRLTESPAVSSTRFRHPGIVIGIVPECRSACPGIRSLQHRLMKTGGRLVKHARYYWLLLAEGHLNRRLFGDMLRRIWALPLPSG